MELSMIWTKRFADGMSGAYLHGHRASGIQCYKCNPETDSVKKLYKFWTAKSDLPTSTCKN